MNIFKTLLIVLLALSPFCLICCSNGPESEADPVGAEVVFDAEENMNGERFTDRDGYCSFSNCNPRGFPPGAPGYALLSPKGNLKMVLVTPGQAGDMTGFKIDYDACGRVREFIKVHDIKDGFEENYYSEMNEYENNTAILRKWMNDRSCEGEHFAIERDEIGNPVRIGDIYVPKGYSAEYSIMRMGNWQIDTGNAYFRLLVILEAQDKKGRSTVDYLYFDDKLVAEKAYWNGVFIKALYYQNGHFDGINDDREQDVLSEIWMRETYGSQLKTPWYVDRKE